MIFHSKPTIGNKEVEAIARLLGSGQLAQGILQKRFVGKLKETLKVNHFFLTGTGTTAQILLLKSLDIGVGQEVIIPSSVCKSVYEAIIAVGATPVFCDTGDSWVMNYDTVVSKITNKTAAVILVHIFGIDAWEEKMRLLTVPILEDFCQSFGLRAGETETLRGLAGFYSFHATKCMTTGEGGGVAVNNDEVAKAIKEKVTTEFRNRFSDYQALLGIAQLEQYATFVQKRKEIFDFYLVQLPRQITDKVSKTAGYTVYFRFPLQLINNKAESLMKFLAERNIAARKGVDTMLHRYYSDNGSFPATEKIFGETLCLPIYPSLTDTEMEHITNSVNEYYNQHS